MPKNEQHVGYNNKPLNLLGYTAVNAKVRKSTIQNARIVITREGKRSLIGRDWLNQRNFKVGKMNGNSEYAHIVHNISERQDTEIFKQKVPKLFSRQGTIKGYKVKCEFKKCANYAQQEGRRILLQRQEAVEAEIDDLLKEGHVRRVEKINDEVVIQPVVITVKKDKTVKLAANARSLSDAILKDKHQMPDLDNLREHVAEIITQETKKK